MQEELLQLEHLRSSLKQSMRWRKSDSEHSTSDDEENSPLIPA